MRALVGVCVGALLLSACGPKTMEARLRDAEKHADRAAGHLDDAQRAMEQLEPSPMEDALEEAKEELAEQDTGLHPEAGMHQDRYAELAAKLPQVKAEREKRDLEQRLDAAREKIVPRVHAMLETQEALTPAAPARELVEALESKAKAVREAIDDDASLFEKSPDFAAWVKSQRGKVDRALEQAARARRGLAFLEGPAAAWRDAQAKQVEARAKKTPGEKEPGLAEARERLAACEKDAGPFTQDAASSAVAFTLAGGKPQTPAQLQAACRAALKAADAELKKVRAALPKPKQAPAPPPKRK